MSGSGGLQQEKCPKCSGKMVNGICTKCKYSPKTAYKSRREAKEFTHPG